MTILSTLQKVAVHSYRVLVLFVGIISIAAAKVEVSQKEDKLFYRLSQEDFLPEKNKKELTSGISTQVVILANLLELPDRIITQQIVSLDAKYNLWEENFRLQYSDGRSRLIKKQTEVVDAIENAGPFVLYPMDDLKNNVSYKVQVIQTINPIGMDRLDSVKKWVTGQKATLQAASSPNDQKNRSSTPSSAFSELFYSLWRRASEGEVLVGEIRREIESGVFTKNSLTNEPRLP